MSYEGWINTARADARMWRMISAYLHEDSATVTDSMIEEMSKSELFDILVGFIVEYGLHICRKLGSQPKAAEYADKMLLAADRELFMRELGGPR